MAYIAVWRHIGWVQVVLKAETSYYLGISPHRLRKYYATVEDAMKIFACHTMHLFTSDAITDDFESTSTYRLLSSVANRPPQHVPVEHSLAVSRFLLGDGFADLLGIPRTTFIRNLRFQSGMFIEWSLVAFGRCWTNRWEEQRITLTRRVIQMIVVWQLGGKRTKFTSKDYMTTQEKIEGVEDDDELDPDVRIGPEAGKAVLKGWRWLLCEMVAVIAVPAVLVVGSAGYAIWR
jgi:hypothetical protein